MIHKFLVFSCFSQAIRRLKKNKVDILNQIQPRQPEYVSKQLLKQVQLLMNKAFIIFFKFNSTIELYDKQPQSIAIQRFQHNNIVNLTKYLMVHYTLYGDRRRPSQYVLGVFSNFSLLYVHFSCRYNIFEVALSQPIKKY